MSKTFAFLVLAALAVGVSVEAGRGNRGLIQNLRGKFMARNHGGNRFHHGGAGGGSSASASASAAAASQPEPEYQPAPQYYPPEPYYQPQQQQHHHQQPQQYYGGYQQPSLYSAPRYEVPKHHAGGSSSAAAAAAAAGGGSSSATGSSAANGAGGSSAAAAAAAAAAAKQHVKPYYVPATPYVNHHAYPRFSSPNAYQAPLDIGSEIAAASSAAAASSTSGKVGNHHNGHHLSGAHIPAEYGAREVYRDEAPIHYASGPQETGHYAASGIYEGDNGINENSYYKKSSEEERNHEDGNEESDHYLSTKSHGKAGEENLRIRQGRDDFDQEIGPYSMKTKKRNNFNFVDYNKSHSETGTSVLQKDRHRSAYNKDTIKSREEIDAASTKYANGRTETSGLKTKSYVDDEDSEYYDSAGLHGQYGQGHGAGAGAASAAAAAGNTASSSSSAAAGH